MVKEVLKHRKQELILMGVLCSFAFIQSIFRVVLTGSVKYLFLNWNLFLAFVPWLITSLVSGRSFKRNKAVLAGLLLIWLLFFPNAPYILTDLFHLKSGNGIIWFDLILILRFAWAGLMFGLISLVDIEVLFSEATNKSLSRTIPVFILFISGFGVYIGRYLRWNSWDVLLNPVVLFQQVSECFSNPLEHPRTWGMTVLLGFFLNLVYWSLKIIRNKKPDVVSI